MIHTFKTNPGDQNKLKERILCVFRFSYTKTGKTQSKLHMRVSSRENSIYLLYTNFFGEHLIHGICKNIYT